MRAKADYYVSTFSNTVKSYRYKQVIPLLKITGHITPRQTYSVSKSLAEVPSKNVKFLAVLINSAGGSPGQCHIISKKLEAFSKENNIPIYTFAEDQATSGGYFLLSCGDKVFANNASLVGGIGAVHRHLNFGKALQEWDVYIEKYSTSEKPLENRLSWTEEFNDQTRSQVRDILQGTHSKFIDHVQNKRGDKLQGGETEKREKLFEGDVYLGGKAKELGLVDEIANFREYLNTNYPEAKIVDVSRPTMMDRVRFVVSKFVAVSSDFHVLNFLTKRHLEK